MALLRWQERLFTQIREKLYHPGTGLIYDYITSFDPAERFSHLPSPEEISHSFPNPCGWSTGMEDCAINTGLMLAWSAAAHDENTAFTRSLAGGLIRCGNVHGKHGFIVRGILPQDGSSCYSNSSRDQFTIAVYGLWCFLNGERIAEDLRHAGIRFICDTADYCEKTVIEKNHYSLLRLDGGPAVVSGLWDCAPHEMLRLPMIYGAAWKLSGKQHYHDLLRRCMETGLRRTLEANPESGAWWDMPLLQMQCSIRFFEDSNVFPELQTEIRQGLHLAAKIAIRKLNGILDDAERFSGDWTVLYDNWRYLPMKLRRETIAPDGHTALFGGFPYLTPEFHPSYAQPNFLIRNIGNYLAVMALDQKLPEAAGSFFARTDRLMSGIDFEHFSGAGIVPMLYGSQLLQNRLGFGPEEP